MSARRDGLAAGVFLDLSIGFLGWLFLACAWLSDDAFVTARVSDNLLGGFGLRWNVDERVQAFTHPLWLALVTASYAATHEVIWTLSLLSVACSLAAVIILAKRLEYEQGLSRAIPFVLLLACSRSVLSYATSGLENPLALLLLVLLFRAPDDRPTRSVLLLSLVMLCRQDLLLVGGPIVLLRLRPISWRARIGAIVVGGLPLVGWEIFSLVYYGLLVPNTALAKLGGGIAQTTLLEWGARYAATLGLWDPTGALLLVCGLFAGLVTRGRAIAIGLVAYAVYIVWIGGDFMCGRFFAIPIVLATYLLCDAPWPPRTAMWIAIFPLFILAAPGPWPASWVKGGANTPWIQWGIVDERIFYTAQTGIFNDYRPRDLHYHYFARHGRDIANKGVVQELMIGMYGYYGGPGVHIVDVVALADPLLARLPMTEPAHFRPGHVRRAIPDGYEQTLLEGRNVIADPDLARYYDAIQLVTRAPIWSASRWRAIVALSTGRLDPLRDAYVRRHPPGAAD